MSPEYLGTPASVGTTEKKHDILTQHHDGRVTAMGRNYVLGTGTQSLNIRVPDLREIEYVTHVQITTIPLTSHAGIMNKKITGNVVGLTIHTLGAAVTAYVEVQAIGPP